MPGLAFAMFNGIVGASIFGLPAIAAGMVGPAAIAGFVICVVVYGLAGLCFAEIGSRVPEPGGLYAYVAASWGPAAGAVAGNLFWIVCGVVPSAAVAMFMVEHIGTLFPALGGWSGRVALLLLLYGAFAFVNIRGTKSGSGVSVAIAMLKLVPLALLVVGGAFALHTEHLAWHSVPTLPALVHAAVFIAFAFGGIETGLTASGEVRRPAYTVPRAILLAFSLVSVLYVGLQVVSQGVLGASLPSQKAPLVAVAGVVFGPWAAWLLSATLVVSVLGYFSADILCTPRCMYALAEQGQLPRWLATVHARFRTPAAAVIIYSALGFMIAVFGSFQYLAIAASSATLLLYATCMLGLLRLRSRGVARAGAPFVVRGGPFLPVIVAALIVGMLASLSWRELMPSLAVVAVATALYAVIPGWRRPNCGNGIR